MFNFRDKLISNLLVSESYKKPGLCEADVSMVGYPIQTRFLYFFILILPDLISNPESPINIKSH